MLEIVDVILEVIELVAPLVEVLEKKDKTHAAQIRDALNSALLNASEGSAFQDGRRLSHYKIALGSSRESLVGLQGAARWRQIPPLSETLLDKYDRVHATLWKNAHPTPRRASAS